MKGNDKDAIYESMTQDIDPFYTAISHKFADPLGKGRKAVSIIIVVTCNVTSVIFEKFRSS